VNMSAEHAQTRQALEQALPTLASALRENGLALTGGGVFEQPRPPRDDAPAPGHAGHLRGEEAGDELLVPATAAARIGPARGVVDLYA
jgi:flagellar hook-length control protein FliK